MTGRIDSSFYHAEATLRPDLPCYVERQADTELLEALRAGKFTVILSSRKVGKSSLLERAFASLRKEGVCTVKKELAEADQGITEESWYAGLIEELVNDARRRNGFEVDPSWRDWWSERANLPAGQRFTDFLRTFFLEASWQPWVIAIDEIDTTIPLPFSDDFFAAVRRCQNARASDPLFNRLTFLLAGVASPAQLIKDNRRTPFNIGRAVAVTDFTAAEAQTLLVGLGETVEVDHPVLQRVMHWTGGHPYLTQRVFLRLAEELEEEPTDSDRDWQGLVDQAVGDTFLRPGARVNEPHLFDIARRRIGDLDKPSNPNADPDLKRRMLAVYRRALAEKVVKDDALFRPCVELKLCGLLIPDPQDPSRLAVRNRIYRSVFDDAWVRAETPRNAWKQNAVVMMLFAVLLVSVLGLLQRQTRIADLVEQIELAETDVPTVAFGELRGFYWQSERAQKLLARYWSRRAFIASVQQPRDEAAILWLKTLSIHETPEFRLQARRALSGSLPYVVATFRHGHPVFNATFSTDGQRVITTSKNDTAQIWDVQTGRPIGTPLKHTTRSWNPKFSEDGQWVVTRTEEDTAQVWVAKTGQPRGSPLKHERPLYDVAFSAEGRQVVTFSSDGIALFWDTESGQSLHVDSALKLGGPVTFAAFNADGRRVVTFSGDNAAQVWDAETGQLVASWQQNSRDYFAAFSADGRRILTASQDGTAQVWDAETGQPLGGPMNQLPRWGRPALSTDGQRVVTLIDINTAQVWDVETGLLGLPLQQYNIITQAAFSADGRRVVTASANGTPQVWDAATGQPLGTPLKHAGIVNHAEFSADGRRVVTASEDGNARVWDAETGKPLGRPLNHEDTINFTFFSADGRRLITASVSNSAQVWDTATGRQLGSPLKHEDTIIVAALSADGRLAVTASEDNTARIWDATSGEPIGKPLLHTGNVNHAAFSADGRWVITAGSDKIAQLWDAATGEPLGSPMKHAGPVNRAEFSADGRRAVTASDDNTARIWDATSGEPIGKPLLHTGRVNHAAFSADGRWVITNGFGNIARLWDAETGAPLGSTMKHDARLYRAALSADRRCIVTSTQDVLTWHLETSPGVWRPEATVWSNGANWMSSALLMEPKQNPTGERIRVADSWTGNIMLIRDLSMQQPEKGLPELSETAQEVLTKYLKRFSLKFEDDQKSPTLQPLYPMAERRDATLRDATASPPSGPGKSAADSEPK